MVRQTKSQARQMAEELLSIQAMAERYDELQKQLKYAMVDLDMPEIAITGKGRVFISTSEKTSISPDLARQVLGALANKVIEIKESVSNKLVEALVQMNELDHATHEQLLAGATKTPVTNLYVRPLK